MEPIFVLSLCILLVSFATTFVVIPWLIPRLKKARLVGRDRNKEGYPEVPEMGGFGIVAGFIVGVLFSIALTTFDILAVDIRLDFVLAGLSTILIMALVGIVDDLFVMRQSVKALLPVFASLPLVAINVGVTHMVIPFFGEVNFGVLFPLVLIPIVITGASNATNMLAGFNGLEAGLGVVMCATLGFVAYFIGSVEAVVVLFAMLGALVAFLYYNRFPARILVGDVGTLVVGAVVATSVILGNIEKVGLILMIPFFAELFLKMRGKFKVQSWCGIKDGKLVCPKKSEVYGLGRLVMYLSGGITESMLVLVLVGVEVLFGLLAVWMAYYTSII